MPKTARAPLSTLSTEPIPLEMPVVAENERIAASEQMPEPPAKPVDVDFFEWMESFSAADWQNCWLYLYRLEPEVLNPGDLHYLEPRYSRALTRDEVSQRHGGGKYRIQLNWRPIRKGFASHEFCIQGPPKFQPGQVIKATGQPAMIEQAPTAGGGDSTAALVAGVIQQLAPLLKPDVSQADAQQKLMEFMTKANDKVLDMVTGAAKKQVEDAVGQSSPNGQVAMLTALLGLVEKLQPKVAVQPNLIEQVAQLAPLLKMLQGNTGGGGIIGEIREALGERVVERLFEPEGGQGSDWKSQAANAAVKLIEQIPTVLDRLVTLQRGAQPTPVPNPPPGNGPILQGIVMPEKPAAQPAPVSVQPAASAADVSTSQPAGEVELPIEALRDGMMKMIVECFERGEDGEDTVLVLSHIAEPLLPELAAKMAGVPLPAVLMWVRAQPQFARIKDSEHLKDFVREFQDELTRWANSQESPEAETAAK